MLLLLLLVKYLTQLGLHWYHECHESESRLSMRFFFVQFFVCLFV